MKQAESRNRRCIRIRRQNPIIFDDADFELAVDQALNGGYFHAGQCASAGSRI